MNPDMEILTITDKNINLEIEMTVENGLGYIPKEDLHKDRIDIGNIALDGVFTPIRRVHYETENMRVGDRTDFNRLIISIETDGTITPKGALEKAIEIMITQLKAIVGFKEEVEIPVEIKKEESIPEESEEEIADRVAIHIEDSYANGNMLWADKIGSVIAV
jgi:DNA-directed RNA polymerase subunit alpha